MNPAPKISVIIPTRERVDVFRHALQTVITQDYDNLEIIVSDNFSQDGTEDICRAANDRRLRYVNTGRRVSMSDNWEFALSHVTDGWVTIIGDDDGLLPGAIRLIATAATTPGIEAVRATPCTYSWPQVVNGSYGRLNVPTRKGTEIRNSNRWLPAVMAGEASCAELPMLYNGGAVHIDVMKRIKEKTGRYFLSCVPDVYSAIAIACAIPRYLYSFEPFAINGASAHSNGRSTGQGGLTVKGSPADKWASEANLPIHEALRAEAEQKLVPAVQFWVYEAYLHATPLRDAMETIRMADQLALILGTAGGLRPVMQEWASKLAPRYDFDLDCIEKEADRIARKFTTKAKVNRTVQFLQTYFAGSPKTPIINVFAASRLAGEIRTSLPGPLRNFASLLARAALRFH